ncbi:MAG: C40 family peptidase [Desulfitobacteriaceae bacterium]|nr:C40 family peptidase [Desulfitobacteriaceae bacterium]MDI6879993.1 C40 family peptidase [Desulfitobacteriaceae bacterium]MDI6914423.1 C40 family peptidase [Desulfitobacteriaceae bacterium]
MQAALPITQPLRLPTYSVAAIVLTSFMVIPIPGISASPAEVLVSEPIRLESMEEGEGWPLAEAKERSATEVAKAEFLAKSERGSPQLTRGEPVVEGKTNSQTDLPEDSKINAATMVADSVKVKASANAATQEEARALIVQHALSWRGVPYAWGGESRAGIDCSALVQTVYQKAGVEMPRTSYEQFRMGVGLPKNQLLPGDLVFFSTNGPGASHVGIYLGEQKFISATSHRVEIQSLDTLYWKRAYRGSRRAI